MPVPPGAREYILKALAGNPQIFAYLLREHDDRSPLWDARPFAERFTLREALAHLADWEVIWRERFELIATEDSPALPDKDEGAIAIENRYETLSPNMSLAFYTERRVELVDYLRSLPDEAWDRMGERKKLGWLTMFQLASVALGHDSYHLRQIVEYVDPSCNSGLPVA